MPDLTTLLSKFLTSLYAGAINSATDPLLLQVGGVTYVTVASSAVTSTVPLLFSADNTHDIGASGATRPRDLYLGRSAVFGGSLDVTGYVALNTTGFFNIGNLSKWRVPAAGQINFYNNADSAGVGLDFATDAVMKVRTRAQTGYATVDALGYRASGAAGVSFGPGAVTSITVVNGIVTAIS